MEEKRYLKWYNKLGYNSGDIARNMVCAMAFRLLILPGMVMIPILLQRFKNVRLVTMVGCGISAIITVLFVVAGP